MKKKLIIILISFSMVSHAQEIILTESVKQYYQLHEEINQAILKNNDTNDAIPEIIEKYEYLFTVSDKDESKHFWSYANFLARSGDLQKAIVYYEKAIRLQKNMANDFDSYYIKDKLFEKDTVLYHQKKKEFYEIPVTYSARELELLFEVKQMYATDQFARSYHNDYRQYLNCSKNILEYVDSITMVKWVKLIEKFPEYSNPLSIDFWAKAIISRHILTAYPEFWLTYFEQKEREELINGKGYPKEYARTFDRCTILTGKEKCSYYGEWDDDGKATNPDKALVNKRRANLGLPPLEEKKSSPYEIFITY